MNSMKFLAAAMLSAAVGGAIASAPAFADDVSDFYKKKRVKVIVGFSPGGGYDRGGRVVGRHISKYIPGTPRVITQNMPGAGSLRLLNWLAIKAPKDGSVIGHAHPAAMREAYIGAAGARFDPRKFYWLGVYTRGSSVLFSRSDSGVTTLKQAMEKQIVLGATSARSGGGVYPRVLNQVLGTKFKVVVGYGSTGESTMAMERGEVQGVGAWAWTQLKKIRAQWLKDKFVKVVALLSVRRRADLPGVPSVLEFAKSDEDRKVMEAIFMWEELSRPFILAPGTHPARAAALRKAFSTMMTKADFKADIEKASMEVDPISGPDAEKLLAKLYAYPKAVGDRARIIYSEMRSIKISKAKKKKVKGLKITKIKGKGPKMKFTFKDKSGTTWKFKAREKKLGRKTKINGKKSKVKNLKVGMVCTVSYYGKGGLAYSANCKG